MKKEYRELYGTWSVTTEGDVEGKSTTNLGTYTGYVDEIALHLADKCYYSLRFHMSKVLEINFSPKKVEVDISFDIESGSWDSIHTEEGLNEMANIFENRPVEVLKNNYYASFKIKSKNKDEILKKQALSKLTEEEKKALGLNQ